MLSSARQEQNTHLTRALESNRQIGVAMGILMAGGKLTEQHAFNQLRTASQRLNRKLAGIAADVTRIGQLPRHARRARQSTPRDGC